MCTSSYYLLLIYWPRRDGRLSWPGWLTHSVRLTHKVVTRQPWIRRRWGKVRRLQTDILTTEPRRQPLPLSQIPRFALTTYFALGCVQKCDLLRGEETKQERNIHASNWLSAQSTHVDAHPLEFSVLGTVWELVIYFNFHENWSRVSELWGVEFRQLSISCQTTYRRGCRLLQCYTQAVMHYECCVCCTETTLPQWSLLHSVCFSASSYHFRGRRSRLNQVPLNFCCSCRCITSF